METVGSYHAKTHLPQLLARVEHGETITITRHGKPIARLVPAGSTTAQPNVAEELSRPWLAFRRKKVRRLVAYLSVRDLMNEGPPLSIPMRIIDGTETLVIV